jgi:endonuclease YncB( thermonuclease family)
MRISHLTYGAILAAICLPQAAYAAAEQHFIPDCAGAVEIAHTSIMRVEQNGAMVLRDGRIVVLEGIRLPERDPHALAERALAALRANAQEGPVTFTATPPKRDRYDRVRVQGFGRQWLQLALLEQGLARVAISPDRDECAPDLYEAEARARARHAGIWALAAYRPRAPQEMKATIGSFQLVEGTVSNVGQANGRLFIDFSRNGQRVFSAVIAPEDRRAFRDFDLEGLPAHRIRIRGIVQDYRGRPEIALSNPAQIEVLD